MAIASDTTWLHQDFTTDVELGNRVVFGIIREATVGEPGSTAFFIIDCSDGTVIEEEFVYPTLNPCDAVGSWATLELSPNNNVGAMHFKLIDEMRAANEAQRIAATARKNRREREEVERQALLHPLLEDVKQRRQAARSSMQFDTFFVLEMERLQNMSLTALKRLHAQRRGAEPLSWPTDLIENENPGAG